MTLWNHASSFLVSVRRINLVFGFCRDKMMVMMMEMVRSTRGGYYWKSWFICGVVGVVVMLGSVVWLVNSSLHTHQLHLQTRRIVVDTDVDTDDVFAIFYLLKQPTSLFHLQVNYSLSLPSSFFLPCLFFAWMNPLSQKP